MKSVTSSSSSNFRISVDESRASDLGRLLQQAAATGFKSWKFAAVAVLVGTMLPGCASIGGGDGFEAQGRAALENAIGNVRQTPAAARVVSPQLLKGLANGNVTDGELQAVSDAEKAIPAGQPGHDELSALRAAAQNQVGIQAGSAALRNLNKLWDSGRW